MATFRKSASKTRAALESSTALPPAASDVLDHVGEQAARMTNPAKAAKSARKAGSVPPQMPGPVDAAAHAVELTHSSLDAPPTAVDLTHPAVERSDAAAETLASTAESIAEVGVEAAEATPDLPAGSIERTTAELERVMADIADQVSHASDDVLRTTTELTAQTLAETAAQTQDIASAMADVAAASTDEAADAIKRASTVGSEAGSSQAALVEFNARLADLLRDYLDDSLAFFAAMTAVRSVPEALTVNQQHFQRRLDAFATQSRDLTMLAQKVAAQTLMPFTPAAFR